MRIDAVSGGNSHYDNQNSLTKQEIKIRDEYNNLLMNFRNTPNKSNGDKLLHFLQTNYKTLKDLAAKNPHHGPKTVPTFENSYKQAIASLQVFEDKKGTPPSMPEEFLGDVHGWINY